MHYIILDLEATCWENRSDTRTNEIIEIGALKIDSTGKTVSEFQAFVKPKQHPELSDFCRKLTSIDQASIDEASSFDVVVESFQKWIDLSKPYLLCSWGFYDKTQLAKDCDLFDISKIWLIKHISLKHQYAPIKKLPRPIGMAAALEMEKIALDGTHHRALDDAKNIAKIFNANRGKWNTDY